MKKKVTSTRSFPRTKPSVKFVNFAHAKPTFTPTADRVLFEREMNPAKEGLIYTGTASIDPSIVCKITAVGPKVEHLKIGDRAMIPFNAGYPTGYGYACRETDVWAVIPEGAQASA